MRACRRSLPIMLLAISAACADLTASAAMPDKSPPASGELQPAAPFIREGTLNQNPSAGKLRGHLLRVKRPLLVVRNLERSPHF